MSFISSSPECFYLFFSICMYPVVCDWSDPVSPVGVLCLLHSILSVKINDSSTPSGSNTFYFIFFILL